MVGRSARGPTESVPDPRQPGKERCHPRGRHVSITIVMKTLDHLRDFGLGDGTPDRATLQVSV